MLLGHEEMPARLTAPPQHARNAVVADPDARPRVTDVSPRPDSQGTARRVVSVVLAAAFFGGAAAWSQHELAGHRAAALAEAHRGAEQALAGAVEAVGQLPA